MINAGEYIIVGNPYIGERYLAQAVRICNLYGRCRCRILRVVDYPMQLDDINRSMFQQHLPLKENEVKELEFIMIAKKDLVEDMLAMDYKSSLRAALLRRIAMVKKSRDLCNTVYKDLCRQRDAEKEHETDV